MSWTELQPIVRTAPRVKAWIRITSAGAQLGITLSDSFHKELGKPKVCDVSAGSGENAGMLRVVFGKTGRFQVVEMKHMARITLPPFEGLPDGARESEACAIQNTASAQGSALIVSLPLDAWAKQVAKPAAAEPPKQPAQAAKVNGNGSRRLDMADYLSRKGLRTTRTGTGWVVDGEKHTFAQVLALVNSKRRIESLPALNGEQVE